MGRPHPRYGSPATAVLALSVTGFVVLAVAVTVSPQSLPAVYAALATLIVYLWVFPYVLICAAHVVLMVRERTVRPFALAASVLGALAMAWVYLNGFVNPPAPPVDSMSYAALALIGVTVPALALARHRNAKPPTPGRAPRKPAAERVAGAVAGAARS
ncbi:hypothetical protein [Streptomyces sp. NPDC051567]|uniref:hypothetical protein n=1 Tax=Streptomyces sp. NPDC051567 TaxID=3365660 RepID=UPI0037B04A9B